MAIRLRFRNIKILLFYQILLAMYGEISEVFIS